METDSGYVLEVGKKVIPNPYAFAAIQNNEELLVTRFENTTTGWCLVDGGTVVPINKYMPKK